MVSRSLTCATIDDSFGPYAQECRGGFDFTLLFEETILSILPLSILLLVAPFRISYLLRKRTKVIRSSLLPLKLATFAVFGALQISLLVLWSSRSTVKTKASVPSTVVTITGSLVLSLLSYAEHQRSVRPSFLLNVYLLFTLLFDAAQSRTLWLQRYNHTIAIVFTVTVAVKLLLVLLEAKEKQSILQPEYACYPPEATSGIYNRSFFWWQNTLFRKGFSNALSIDSLFTLDKHLMSEYMQDKFQSAWGHISNKGPHSLFVLALSKLRWPIFAAMPPRVFLIAFNFCQPFLINRAVNLAQQPVDRQTTNIGYGLIGAYFLVYVGIAISMGQYQHLTYRAITMVRGGLISMLYNKATDLSITAVDPASSLTLMSADIERITTGMQTMHEIWANVFEVTLAIYLLERQLGVACAMPIGVSIISLVGSLAATSLVMQRQQLWLAAIEKRITATASMLGAMKGVKMCGLTDVLEANLQQLRVDELNISKKFRKLLIWNMGFAYISPVVAPILTFAVFSVLARDSNGQRTLDTARVFTSLSLFSLLTEPLGSLIMSLATFMGAVGCFQRIQAFLDTEPRVDRRKKPLLLTDSARTSQSDSVLEKSGGASQQSGFSVEKFHPGEQYPYSSPDTIFIQDGCFGWDKEKNPSGCLKSINMVVPRAKLTMLVGPVGCGKSTLLKAILGELPMIEGTVQLSSLRIAYCDQTPWHMNGTVQQSIIAVSEFDQRWYTSVIRACALHEDLHQLPQGDQTQIGSKGIALSGGQSQRIALARAIYAQKDIVILDDSLSGLDAHTENRVWHNLFGRDGILKRNRSTILIASSSAKRLPYADHVIALDSDGKIAEQGPFEALNKTGGYVSSFSLSRPESDKPPEQDEPTSPTTYSKSVSESKATEEDLQAEASRRTGDVAIYLYYINTVGWVPTVIFIVSITIFIFGISFPNLWVKWWASANTRAPNANLGYYLGIYALLGILALIFLVISCWQMIITMVPRSGVAFHWKLLQTVLRAPMTFFSTTDTGVTLNRFSQDLQLIDMELPIAALNTFATLVLCIAQMILIALASPYAAISVPPLLLALYLLQKFYLRTSRQLRFLDLEAKSPLYTHFSELLAGLATVRAFHFQPQLQKQHRRELDRSQRPFYLLFAVQRWLTLVLDLVVAAMAVLLAVLVVVLRGRLSAGYVGVALLNVILFSQSVKMLVSFWTQLETHIGSVARIKTFTRDTPREDLEAEKGGVVAGSWPQEGRIEWSGVTAGYRPTEPVIKNLSLTVEAGQKVAIVGRTGSGKSSLVLTLFRMLDPSSGSIAIDGVPLSVLPRQTIRSRLIGVPQDAYLLPGSVRLNADPLKQCTDKEITVALKAVQLWDIVVKNSSPTHHSHPLDVDVEELHLSHGQRQLFCLARAMLRRSRVLVLDEATSSMDSQTDALIQRLLRSKFAAHTIIAVAHKLDTILDFDRVAVMDNGTLIEFDAPYKLLGRPESAFAKLYAASRVDEDDDF